MTIKVNLSLLFFLLLSNPHFSWGFFPSNQTIREDLSQVLFKLESLQAKITFLRQDPVSLLVWQTGNKWHQEWVLEKDTTSRVVAAGIGTAHEVRATYPELDYFNLPFFFIWSNTNKKDFWVKWGIDPRVKSYQFCKQIPCLVLGAERERPDQPQLWIHNEFHYPVRLITGNGIKWSWLDYISVGNIFLPHRVQVEFSNSKKILMHINWHGVNWKIPDKLFSMHEFFSKFPKNSQRTIDSNFIKSCLLSMPIAEY